VDCASAHEELRKRTWVAGRVCKTFANWESLASRPCNRKSGIVNRGIRMDVAKAMSMNKFTLRG